MGRPSETPILILEALWARSPMSIRQISETTGKKETTIEYFTLQMLRDGRIAKVGVGQYAAIEYAAALEKVMAHFLTDALEEEMTKSLARLRSAAPTR